MRTPHRVLAGALALGLVAAACGSDDDSADDATTGDTAVEATDAPTTDAPTTEAPTTDAPTTDAPAEEIGTVTVYSGRGEDLVGPLLELFEEETGIDTEVRYGDSAEMLLLIQEEGDNSPADVYYSQGAGFLGELSSTGAFTTSPRTSSTRFPSSCARRTATGWASPAVPAR
jgi:iron(III) transport system substrate-binding protein